MIFRVHLFFICLITYRQTTKVSPMLNFIENGVSFMVKLFKYYPQFTFEGSHKIEAKGKGEMEMWFVSLSE
jgi:hypothetical protein